MTTTRALMNKFELIKQTKTKMFKLAYRIILMYSCELFALSGQDECNNRAAEM